MTTDHLSEVFDVVEVRGQMSGAFAARGHWIARSRISRPLKLVAMVRGHGRLTTDGVEAPLELAPGDIAILSNRSWLALEGGTGDGPPSEIEPELNLSAAGLAGVDADVVVGGNVDLNPAGRALLLQALPPVGHVRASTSAATQVRTIIQRLIDEVTAAQLGSTFAIHHYGQLLLLEVLRAYAEQAQLPPGWLRVLTDDRLRPAVTLMHAEPGRPWRLEDLARAAKMSRTTFAERFRATAGIPPLAYLNAWRMLRAQQALRHRDVSVGALAAELGYTSESAFSTAFKREVGASPLRYRTRERTPQPTP